MNQATSHRSPLERFLGIFTEVRAGEGPVTLIMAFNVFLLLTSYYLIKPVRDGLILADGGAEAKAYLVGAMAVVLFFLVGGYAKLVSRYERTRLITVVTAAFIACLVIFWALSRMDVPYLGYVFFVWVGIFSVMVVAQFWSYANDVYNNESGKRLFPLVAFGGSVGAFAGAGIAGWLLTFISLYEMLLVAGAVLGLCIVLTVLGLNLLGDGLATVAPGAVVVVSGLPPAETALAFRRPLRDLLGLRASAFTHIYRAELARFGITVFDIAREARKAFRGRKEMFSSDLFHPSSAGYSFLATIYGRAVREALDTARALVDETAAEELAG